MLNKWKHLFIDGEYARREKILSGLTLEQVKHQPSEQLMWSSGTGHKAHAAPLIFNFQLLFKFHRAFVAQTGM